jgi:hypothetical protein
MAAAIAPDDAQLFEFESDFVATLRCVPMAVRLKLDRCGLKITLRQWSRLHLGDREILLHRPCRAPDEISAYAWSVSEMVALRAHESVMPLAEDSDALREMSGLVPAAVVEFARLAGVKPPNESDWALLSELQRFALVKLSRKNHDNVNFVPAMLEFKLA